MGDHAHGQATFSAEELLAAAQERNHVYHIFLEHGQRGGRDLDSWKQTLGPNCLVVKDYKEISKLISDTVMSQSTNIDSNLQTAPSETDGKVEDATDHVEPML
jgi:hypothetical protein